MDEDRKPNSLAKLRNLSPEKKGKLQDWLEQGLSYRHAVPLIQKEFGIATSVGALCKFWESEVAPLRLARRLRAAHLASALGQDQEKIPVKWDPVLDDSLKEMAFELMQLPQADPEKVFFLMQLVLKTRAQAQKKIDAKLKRDKFEFDAAKAALKHLDALRAIKVDKSLDASSRLEQARLQLFGVAPA